MERLLVSSRGHATLKPLDNDDTSIAEHVWGFYESLDGWLQAIIVIGAAVTVLATFLRWIRPRLRNFFGDLRAIRDTLVGRPAMRDSITDRIIPGTALPGIGERMASQEQAVAAMSESVKALVENNQRLDDHERRIERMEDALHIDRRLDKIESVQLLRTIETVAQAEATPPPEGERPD
jgi:hypothetical protein